MERHATGMEGRMVLLDPEQDHIYGRYGRIYGRNMCNRRCRHFSAGPVLSQRKQLALHVPGRRHIYEDIIGQRQHVESEDAAGGKQLHAKPFSQF